MWFGIEDDGNVVMTTFTKSQKIRNIERDPRVSLLVESGTVYAELRGVVIYGKAELVREHEKILDILAKVTAKSAGGAGNAPDPGSLRKALMAHGAEAHRHPHPRREDRVVGPQQARRACTDRRAILQQA